MSGKSKLPGIEERVEPEDMPAGDFSSWLYLIRRALINEDGVDVPCGECNACCRSSFFIHIRPEETETLARIPKELLFAAPLMPKGNKLMGYNEHGCCPMLIDDKCSIYEHRALTCRHYDCRILPAAGITEGDDKILTIQPVRRWKFSYPTQRDINQQKAVQAAATFLREHNNCFPAGSVPSNPVQLAILAIKVYDVFLKDYNEPGKIERESSDLEVAQAVLEAAKKFEAERDKAKGHSIST